MSAVCALLGFCSVWLPVNFDFIRKRYFTGVNEIMQLPPYI